MPSAKFRGAILDLDGVVTATARVHALAWEGMFNDFLRKVAKRENKNVVLFDRKKDYLQYVDGKPRREGVKSFLASRGIKLPYGTLDDPPDRETLCGLGNRKNLDFQERLRRDGPGLFDSSVRFIRNLRKKGIRVGVASSSRNCQTILQLAGIETLFETRVDGEVSRELKLKGKPRPDIFVTAARNLGLIPGDCMVVEDAIVGVEAGRNGNFGLTLGIAREVKGEVLRQHGADLVVHDLSEVSVEEIENWFERGIDRDGWVLTYEGFDSEEEKLREALCTVGNGYMGTRGCFEGEKASAVHYPGTYIAGVYNNLTTRIEDRKVFNDDLVNCPNWLPIEFRIGGGNFVSPLELEVLSYVHTLNMREGVMERSIVCRDTMGRISRIHSRRLASMADPHLCAIRYEMTPLNYSDLITVRSSLDGTVINEGVARYRGLNSKHLSAVDQGKTRDGIFLHVQTNRSKCQIVMSARTAVSVDGKRLVVEKRVKQEKARVCEEISILAQENSTYRVEKLVSVYTSHDPGISSPRKAAREALSRARTFHAVYRRHLRAWEALWAKCDVRIRGDRFVQRVARLHIYHLLVTASPHHAGLDAGIPARGLHGEAYRGHIFWDELYILPFFNLRLPEVSRAHLMYRYRRLDAARKYARQSGYSGAMYPWQTADDGREVTQVVHYNPKDGTWGPDLSRRQRHVSIAVFYDAWKYVCDTGDRRFLEEYGAEIMLEIARFWASITRFSADTGRYHIEGVMGPDEFHEKLPGSSREGLSDNTYTNIMVVWLLEKTLEWIERLPKDRLQKLKRKTGFQIGETEKWKAITKKMNVVFVNGKVLSQFDGYHLLKELDWNAYRRKHGQIGRMDRILKAEGDSPDAYSVTKQPDALMMFYLLPAQEIVRLLSRLDYPIADALAFLRANFEYHEKRTTHGSTLSSVVHAVIASYLQLSDAAWDWFLKAAKSDIFDTQGGTTREGIHCGVMAGTVDFITRCLAGIDLSGELLQIEPRLPEHWKELAFKIRHRNIRYELELSQKAISVKIEGKRKRSVRIKVLGKEILLRPGRAKVVAFGEPPRPAG